MLSNTLSHFILHLLGTGKPGNLNKRVCLYNGTIHNKGSVDVLKAEVVAGRTNNFYKIIN